MTKLRREEQCVQAVLQRAIPGAAVSQHDNGSAAAMYDLDLTYPDGRRAAVEVTTAVHPRAVELWRLIGEREWVEPNLIGGWAVCLWPNASAKQLRRRLPSLLRRLEAEGVTESVATPACNDAIAQELDALAIESVEQSGTERPGSIYPMVSLPSEQSGCLVPESADGVAAWLDNWLYEPSRADNLRKLGLSKLDERHLFLIVGVFGDVPFEVTHVLTWSGAQLPTKGPQTPSEVTDVWLMSAWSTERGLRWSSTTNCWSTFDTSPFD